MFSSIDKVTLRRLKWAARKGHSCLVLNGVQWTLSKILGIFSKVGNMGFVSPLAGIPTRTSLFVLGREDIVLVLRFSSIWIPVPHSIPRLAKTTFLKSWRSGFCLFDKEKPKPLFWGFLGVAFGPTRHCTYCPTATYIPTGFVDC
jgi:hypothetical protein